MSVRPLIVDLGREYRGGQHQAFVLLQGLRQHGQSPQLIAVEGSELATRAADIDVPVHDIPPQRRRWSAVQRIRQLLREGRVDLIHANEPHALTAAWIARAHRSVPVVASRRVTLPLSRGRFSLARYRAAARIVAVSHAVEKSVVASGLPPDLVSVIYDGVDIPPEISEPEREAARTQLGISRDNPAVGYVAAFVPQKRHAFLLEAFAQVKAQLPGALLLLRGEGPEWPHVQARAGELHIRESMKLVPLDVPFQTAFAATDVFAFPALDEAMGTALLSAMARGLPVVASASGGVPEAVENEKNGILAGTSSAPREFAAAIAGLLSQRNAAATLGQSARETIVRKFSADRMVEETERLYQELIAARFMTRHS